MQRKHAHVSETLIVDEGRAPFVLAPIDADPLDRPTRCALDWSNCNWIETDPATGIELGRGSYERGTL